MTEGRDVAYSPLRPVHFPGPSGREASAVLAQLNVPRDTRGKRP